MTSRQWSQYDRHFVGQDRRTVRS